MVPISCFRIATGTAGATAVAGGTAGATAVATGTAGVAVVSCFAATAADLFASEEKKENSAGASETRDQRLDGNDFTKQMHGSQSGKARSPPVVPGLLLMR